jgi:hypothetical protein
VCLSVCIMEIIHENPDVKISWDCPLDTVYHWLDGYCLYWLEEKINRVNYRFAFLFNLNILRKVKLIKWVDCKVHGMLFIEIGCVLNSNKTWGKSVTHWISFVHAFILHKHFASIKPPTVYPVCRTMRAEFAYLDFCCK